MKIKGKLIQKKSFSGKKFQNQLREPFFLKNFFSESTINSAEEHEKFLREIREKTFLLFLESNQQEKSFSEKILLWNTLYINTCYSPFEKSFLNQYWLQKFANKTSRKLLLKSLLQIND